MTDPEIALKALLAEPLEEAIERERTTFDALAGPFGGRLVLFGAGRLGRKVLACLRARGLEPLAFVDNKAALWGEEVDGVRVQSPEEAAHAFGRTALFVVAIWLGEAHDRMSDRVRQLRDLGCGTVVPFTSLFWAAAGPWLPHYTVDLPHKVLEAKEKVLRACALLHGEADRREFLAQVRLRLRGDFDALPEPVPHEIYFPGDLITLRPDEAFVDCGAFDGDTARAFLARCGGAFGSIDAFEPDPGNFARLEAFRDALPEAARDLVHLHCAATGRQAGMIAFDAQGTASSHVGSGSLQVPCLTLDEALRGRRPSFVKMDIEGSELDTLAGASGVLQEARPILAVCVYHLQAHLWEIPLLIHQLLPGHALFLRPHVHDGWDLVLYAVPPGRLTGQNATASPMTP